MSAAVSAGWPDQLEQVAALVVVLSARAAAQDSAGDQPPALWRERTALVRAPLMAGRGSWRASALPR